MLGSLYNVYMTILLEGQVIVACLAYTCRFTMGVRLPLCCVE